MNFDTPIDVVAKVVALCGDANLATGLIENEGWVGGK